jgi:hypothetical protein
VIDGPGFPAISRDEVGAVGSACPDLVLVNDADAAQRFGGMARLRLPLRESSGGDEANQQKSHS